MADILVKKTGTGVKDFLSALVKPLQTNTDKIKAFETLQNKHLKWNGQKIVLQAALNDLFGITASPFIIVEMNQSIASNDFFFEESELSPVYFSEPIENDGVFFNEPGELSAEDYDFKILIPTGIYTAELDRQVRAQTMIYKISGPKFLIETY